MKWYTVSLLSMLTIIMCMHGAEQKIDPANQWVEFTEKMNSMDDHPTIPIVRLYHNLSIDYISQARALLKQRFPGYLIAEHPSVNEQFLHL